MRKHRNFQGDFSTDFLDSRRNLLQTLTRKFTKAKVLKLTKAANGLIVFVIVADQKCVRVRLSAMAY